jgi:hypothetical protein
MQNEKFRMQSVSILRSAFLTLHLNWPPRLVSRQRLLLFREALICLSYSGRLNEERKMKNEEQKLGNGLGSSILHSAFSILHLRFVPRGNAPRSFAYRASALLLSYETMVNCGLMPKRLAGRKTIFTFPVGRIRMVRTGL